MYVHVTFEKHQARPTRQSWGTDKHLRHVRFFIGDPNDDYIKRRVALEQADHGDVHMSPWYTDSNSNDTLKVYDMLEWAINLPNITHLIKVASCGAV